MASCRFILIQEYVCIAKVTVGPPLSRLIPELFSDEQSLPDRTNSRAHISAIKVGINRRRFEVDTNTAFTIMRPDKVKIHVDKN